MSNIEAKANDPDLRLLKMCQDLTEKNQRLDDERKNLGTQNVQLAFKVGDLEKQRQALTDERETLTADKQHLGEQLAQAEGRLQEVAEKLRALEQESQRQLDERTRQLQEQLQHQLQAQAERLAGESSKAQDILRQQLDQAMEQSRQQLEQSKEQSRQQLEQATEQARQQLEQAMDQARQQREQALEQIREAQARQEATLIQVREAQARQEAIQSDLERTQKRLAETEEELRRSDERARSERERAQRLDEQLVQVRSERESEGTSLRSQLEERDRAVAELEATVREFKEQFLEKAQTSLGRSRPHTVSEAKPREVLRYLAEETLGSTGRILVDSIFSRLGHDPDTTDGAQLGEVVAQLEDYSQSLATPDQYGAFQEAMTRFKSYLDHAEDSVELLSGPAGEEEEVDELAVLAAQLQQAAPAPIAPPPAARAEAPPPQPEAPAVQTPAPVQAARVPEPEPAPSAPVPELQSAPVPEPVLVLREETPPAPEPAPAGETPPPAAQPGEEEPLVRLEDEEPMADLPTLSRASDPALKAKIEEGMKLLSLERYEQSLDLFVALHQQHPDCIEVLMGLFYNYVGFDCYMEAYEFGARIMPALLAGEGRDRFVVAMSSVLRARLEQTRNLGEKKSWLLQLAELQLDKPQNALKYLRQAQRMPDEIPGDGRISFYLTRLLADTKEDRMPYLHTYMSRVAESSEVFRHVQELYESHKFRAHKPAVDMVLALGQGDPRAQAEAAQKSAPGLLAEVSDKLMDQSSTPQERALLELFLDKLLPGAGVKITFPSPRFEGFLSDSNPAKADWAPAALAQGLRQSLFGSKQAAQIHRYSGSNHLLVEISPEKDWVVLIHERADQMPPDELTFQLLRRYYQAQRRHIHLYRGQEGLNDGQRRALLQTVLSNLQETTTPALAKETERLLSQGDEVTLGQWYSLLDWHYNHGRQEDFKLLFRFFSESHPFQERLGAVADQFAARVVGAGTACYALARDQSPQALELAAQGGFQALYAPPLKTYRALRLRCQRLWLAALKHTGR